MISLKNIDFFYNEDKFIFKDFNLTLEDKKKYLIQGKNGTGKTTLMRILLGISKVKSGEVILSYNKQKVLFIPSTPFYEPYLNLEEFTKFYLNQMIKIPNNQFEMETLMSHLSLKEHRKTLCKDLSKGTIQKIMISPLFTQYNWDCLLMDEPFEHLDMDTCNILKEKISQSNSLVVLINHKEHLLDEEVLTVFERVSL